MENVSDFLNIIHGEITQHTVFHITKLTRIDKQYFTFAVTQFTTGFIGAFAFVIG